MKTSRFFMYLFMVFAITLTACSEDGEDGMDGMDGAPGAQGPAGEDGQDGEDGNANVTSVLLENVSVVNGINNYDIPEITQEIYDHGFIIGYVTVNGNQFWEAMPVTQGGTVILELDRYSVGSVQIRTTFDQNGLNMRFVLVEGNPSSGRSAMSFNTLQEELYNNGVDITNYEEVAAYYELE